MARNEKFMLGQNSTGFGVASANPTTMSLSSNMSESKREPEMARALNRQTSIISDLESLCNLLEQRLQSIIRPATPTASDSTKPDRVLPIVIQNLDDNSNRIYQITVYLNDLLSRVEV